MDCFLFPLGHDVFEGLICFIEFIEIPQVTMDQENDNLTRIVRMFQAYNCNQDTLLTRDELSDILDQQAKRKLGRPFNQQIVR